MPNTSAQFALALQCHRNGEFGPASDLCYQVLESEPAHADAWHLLGVIAHQVGRHKQAIDFLSRAIVLCPGNAAYYSNLGAACAAVGNPYEAATCYRRALNLRPELAEAHNNLGNALRDQGKPDRAAEHYRHALRLKPDYAEAHNNLGTILKEQGQLDEAVCHYRNALQLKPTYSAARTNLALALQHMSVAATELHERGAHPQAERLCRQVLETNPAHAESWALLGVIAYQRSQYELALDYLEKARANAPGNALICSNLAEVYRMAGQTEQAVARGREAVQLQPGLPEAHHNLGLALLADCRAAEAVAEFDATLKLVPENAEAHLHRALAWQTLGDYERGWPEYEWRWKCPNFVPPSCSRPLWDGSPLDGRTILLHVEQGIGDTVQFIRFAAVVKQQGGTVLVECPPSLVTLLSTCPGIDRVLPRGSTLPDFDVHAALMSLPAILGTTLATVPAQVPYLFPEPTLVAHWRRELSAVREYKIGIVWQGSAGYQWDHFRSIALREFAPLAALGNVRLFSLQKGRGLEQLRAVADRWPITDLGSRLDETTGAFVETAALLHNLDLVIAPDTALAHLAGALGVPVWLACARATEARWLLDREDTRWYPTMRLFRQKKLGEWSEVMQRMQDALRPRIAAHVARQSLRVEIAPGELIDKITILEIKNERITDPAKLQNVRRELTMLLAVRDQELHPSEELARLTAELKQVNVTLWQIEDDIRVCERRGDFGPRFVELARSVYLQNDRRGTLKRRINELLGSVLMEEKAYSSDVSR